MQENNQKNKEYFDVTTNSSGYLSRLREIQTRKGGYHRVDFSARFGHFSAMNYVKYDLKVSDKDLEDLIRIESIINKKDSKVTARVVIADASPEIYTYEKDGKEISGVTMKGRLLQIIWCAHNDKLLIDNRQVKEQAEAEGDSPTPHAEANAEGEAVEGEYLPAMSA